MVVPRNKVLKRLTQQGIDIAIASLVWCFSYALRFDGIPGEPHYSTMLLLLPMVVVGKLGLNLSFGLYRNLWHYTSLRESIQITLSAFSAAMILGLFRTVGVIGVPYGVVIIDGAFYVLGIVGIRVVRRIQVRRQKYYRSLGGPRHSKEDGAEEITRVLIVGAGDTGYNMIRELKGSGGLGWELVGLVDDDPSKHGTWLHGYPILGSTNQIESIVRAAPIDQVLIPMSVADPAFVRDLARRVRGAGAKVSLLSGMRGLFDGFGGHGGSSTDLTVRDLENVHEVQATLLTSMRENGGDRGPVLVTGGAGYIGSHLVRRLLENRHRVRVLDNFMYGRHGLDDVLSHPHLEIAEGDICNVRDVVATVKDVETVVALAAIVGDPACGIDAEATLNLNYESTKILLEACKFYGVGRIVFASSCSVYGAQDDDLLNENSPLNPVSLYAHTRILSEDILFDRSRDWGCVEPVVLRLATVFGLSPRMRFDLVVNTMTARAVVDGSFQIYGGDQWRPFVHCHDAAKAFYLAAFAPSAVVDRQIFNVGSDRMNYQISEIGQLVATEVPGTIVESRGEVEDRRSYRVSFGKINDYLGFQPTYGLRGGIREIVTALEEDPHLRGYDHPAFSNVQSLRSQFSQAPGGVRTVGPGVIIMDPQDGQADISLTEPGQRVRDLSVGGSTG